MANHQSVGSFVRAAVACLCSAGVAAAQCKPEWLPGDPICGLNGHVNATVMWDPDGPGLLPPVLVVGGEFTVAGGVHASRLAMWDGTAWSEIGGGINGTVYALAARPNGKLVVGGNFTYAGEVPTPYFAEWEGSAWRPMGVGPGNVVRAMVVRPNGNVVVGGQFPGLVTEWDGSSFTNYGTGGTGFKVEALALAANGDIIAGVSSNGPSSEGRVNRWNGTAWTSLGAVTATSGLPSINSVTVLPGGDIVAGGNFTKVGSLTVNRIARFNGSTWSAFGGGADGTVFALSVDSSGALLAGGVFNNIAGIAARKIARWDGTTWTAIPGFNTTNGVLAITALASKQFIVGGGFQVLGLTAANNVAIWNGAAWAAYGRGTNDAVQGLLALPDGKLIAGGLFNQIGGTDANLIAQWDPATDQWTPFGTGMTHTQRWPMVRAIVNMVNGDVFAGGTFTTAGSVGANHIARWDGSAWSALGTGVTGGILEQVAALQAMPNGDLVVGGGFSDAGAVPGTKGIARWDGTNWNAMGTGVAGGSAPSVRAFLLLPNGDLIAGGEFTTMNGVTGTSCVARWNGSTWSAMGNGVGNSTNGVNALARMNNGDVVAAGELTTISGGPAYRIARWNGVSWSVFDIAFGLNDTVHALKVLDNGDLIAAGAFDEAGGNPANGIARWNGTEWSAMGDGLTAGPVGSSADTSGNALAVLTDGTLVAGGNFTIAGTELSAFLARWGCETSCAADFDGDGFVSGTDFDLYVVAFEAGEMSADFDGDGFVSGVDFDLYVVAFEKGC